VQGLGDIPKPGCNVTTLVWYVEVETMAKYGVCNCCPDSAAARKIRMIRSGAVQAKLEVVGMSKSRKSKAKKG
jgi:hypothetical protein